MTIRRSLFIYGVLLLAWTLVLGWLAAEHVRIRKSAETALRNRAQDISSILGLVIRSQRRFGGVISKDRLESAMNSLLSPEELSAIALLNSYGEVVASAGPINLEATDVVPPAEFWGAENVSLMNFVDLGTSVEPANAAIVVDTSRPNTNRPAAYPPQEINPEDTNAVDLNATNTAWNTGRTNNQRAFRQQRPHWMSEEDYKAMLDKQGVHSLLLVMSTKPIKTVCNHDLWMRGMIGLMATLSVVGSGFAWRTFAGSSDLQIRLVRASQLNLHLKEMNLAAAGLAHETRNPLNIIRGLAHIISKQEDATPEIRKKSRDIINEADRVTAQLNEFINYSRPREVRRSMVVLSQVIHEIVRTLNFDIEEKRIHLQMQVHQISIEADERSLRQALFNLILNAIQAADKDGEILIVAEKDKTGQVTLEIRDNGPGVPPERRTEIFKPYFTTNEKGTGLGLAVVQQITLAHGWEVECLPNQPRGAIFRLSHIKAATPTLNITK
jgi:signal transduction histidine kinase